MLRGFLYAIFRQILLPGGDYILCLHGGEDPKCSGFKGHQIGAGRKPGFTLFQGQKGKAPVTGTLCRSTYPTVTYSIIHLSAGIGKAPSPGPYRVPTSGWSTVIIIPRRLPGQKEKTPVSGGLALVQVLATSHTYIIRPDHTPVHRDSSGTSFGL